MKKKEKTREIILEKIIQDTFWMARRYAHGRHTYSPTVVREAFKQLKDLGIKIPKDITIDTPTPDEINGMSFRSDYLDDINL